MKTPVKFIRWVLGYEGIPRMARPTFRYDLLSNLFAALGWGALLSSLTGQFARRGLGASAWIVAVLVALMGLGNLTSTFLAQHMARHRRVPLVVIARLGMALFLASVAVLPANEVAAESFVALLAPAYVLAAIVLNVQASVRHSNYPEEVRGRIFGRLSIVRLGGMAASAMLGGYAMDHLVWGHRLVYILAAAVMVLSAWFYSKLRVRRERAMLRDSHARRPRPLDGFRLLAKDRRYGRFMLWQMISGAGNLMGRPMMILVMTDYLGVGYGKGISAMTLTPFLVAACTAPLAGKLLDHVRITHYRGFGAAAWAFGRTIVFLAVLKGSWAGVLAGFAVQGLGWSTGNIAYNIGHMHFTTPNRSQDYMGIHLTLQGIRNLLAPFLGVALFKLPGVGINALLIVAALQFLAAVGFFFTPPPARVTQQIKTTKPRTAEAFDCRRRNV